MYLGYAAFMLCRNTLISCSAEMMLDPSLEMDKESFGRLMSWHSAGAIMGKLVTGPGADWLGGRRMFLIALSLTALANVGFAFGSSFFTFAAFNFFGQFAKAGGWPAMTKIVGQWYPENRLGQVWSIISTSSRVGTIAAGLLLGYLLSLVSWRAVFVVSAVLTGGVVISLFFLLKERPDQVGLTPLADQPREDEVDAGPREIEPSPHPFDSLSFAQVCWQFACTARFWSICFSVAFLTILMDFLTFIPIYLSEALQISGSQASMAGSTFPAGMFTALVLTISPAYYIPMSVFAVAFGGKHSGFLVALIDVFGYSAALLFNFFGGSIAQHYGWSVFLSGLLTIAVLATACMTAFLTLDWHAHRSEPTPA